MPGVDVDSVVGVGVSVKLPGVVSTDRVGVPFKLFGVIRMRAETRNFP